MNILEHVLGDKRLKAEIEALTNTKMGLPQSRVGNVSPSMMKSVIDKGFNLETAAETRPWTEAVILEFTRPVLFVKNNRFELPASEEMRRRLLAFKPIIERPIPSVGRIELQNHPQRRWDGTGWVVADGIIATNRHVAEKFAYRKNGQIQFVQTFQGKTIAASIDFAEEVDSNPVEHAHEVSVEQVLFLQDQDPNLPDVALLKLRNHGSLPVPIPLQTTGLRDRLDIAVIGYPAQDFRGVESTEAARRIFGEVYDVKRLAPGQVMISNDHDWYFTHDASTLGGNSGSVIIDIRTGAAIGMHFLGKLHEANYAVKASAILDCLTGSQVPVQPWTATSPALGTPSEGLPEATVDSYADRVGYVADFLGPGNHVSLPEVREPSPLLRVNERGEEALDGESVLKYTHFSVAMNKARKLCYYSAVNIDGATSRRGVKREHWRRDPRIPAQYRIDEECYGDAPRFSRGHMTRKEDPIWGEDALQGNRDSMHLTNVTPQMQMFNSPVWLGLEEYALEASRQDQARISVFTGPVFRNDDPVRYGIQIPVKFWKVIAFVHDETKQMSATGYLMSQEEFLVDEESVYGPYVYNDKNYQIPIRLIEQLTGLSFGPLADQDPLKGDFFVENAPAKLLTLDQIRFTTAP